MRLVTSYNSTHFADSISVMFGTDNLLNLINVVASINNNLPVCCHIGVFRVSVEGGMALSHATAWSHHTSPGTATEGTHDLT